MTCLQIQVSYRNLHIRIGIYRLLSTSDDRRVVIIGASIYICEIMSGRLDRRRRRHNTVTISARCRSRHSMLGGVCDVFCRQLALSALVKSSVDMTQILDVVYDDVRGAIEHESTMCCESSASSGGSSDYGGVSAESVTVIADCTDWSIRVRLCCTERFRSVL